MARGLDGFVTGLALGNQSIDQGARLGLQRISMQQQQDELDAKKLEASMRRAAGVAQMAMLDPTTGLLDPGRLTSPEAVNSLNTLLKQDPVFANAFGTAFTRGSEAEKRGYTRVPVAFEPVRGVDGTPIPGKVGLRVQWRDASGKVVSEGPMTAGGTNNDDDQVVLLSGQDLQSGFLGLAGAYSPELRKELQESMQQRRDVSALKAVAGIKPVDDGVLAPAAPAQSQPTTAAARPAANAVPALAASASAAQPSVPKAAEVADGDTLDVAGGDAFAQAYSDVQERTGVTRESMSATQAARGSKRTYLKDQLKAAGEELAKLAAPAADANHSGARRAKYEQDLKAAQEKVARLSAEYQGLGEDVGAALNAVPAVVAPAQVPETKFEAQRVAVAASAAPADAAPKLQALQAATRKRGTPKLNEEQKDALAWLTARGKISAEQYDRAMRTGRLSQSTKKMVSDGVSGLWVMDDDGAVSHINGPYTAALVAAKGKKGAGSGDAEKDVRDFLNFYYPGDKEADFKRSAVPQVAGLTSAFGKQLSDEGMHGVVSDAIEAQRSVAGKFSGMIDSRVNGAPIKSLVPFAVFRQTNTPIEPALDRVVLPVRKHLAKELGTDDVQLSEEEWAKVALATARGMNAKMPDNELVDAIVRNVLAARGK